ncbi:DUF397 domain-containing protein [Haloglycomyces albus]|uniref:DUF397 domain-containing protein n=1 Tax=Haloglycomyces albus TaxID=526067 RepID=UPI0009FDF58D
MSKSNTQPTSHWNRSDFWKSSRSNGSGNGNCVMVAVDGEVAAIADSKLKTSDSYELIEVSTDDLSALVKYVKRGQ